MVRKKTQLNNPATIQMLIMEYLNKTWDHPQDHPWGNYCRLDASRFGGQTQSNTD